MNEPVILIGHSLGASAQLKYLSEEKNHISMPGLFLVATPHWKSNMKEFELEKDFQTFLKNIPAIYLYHSKNDTEVPFENLKFYETTFTTATVRKLQEQNMRFRKVCLN